MDILEYANFWINRIHRPKIATQEVESIHDIDFNNLKKLGVRLLIFDVDDTITPHKRPLPRKTIRLLKKLKDFKIAFLSNCSESRRKELAKMIDVYIAPFSSKPGKIGFTHILEKMSVPGSQAAMIGDKKSMDLWGAKIAGINHRILVKPYSEVFGGHKCSIFVRFFRKLDNI